MITVECDWCGGEFSDYRSRIERTDGKYCSQECSAESKRIRGAGECARCGETFDERPSRLARAEHNFCSKSCRADWMAEQNKRHKSSLWKGGLSDHDRNYGPNWEKQRKAALERDGVCFMCGEADDLVVHHKRRVKNYDRTCPGWWRKANALDNLITLCRSCHSHVHANEEQYLGSLVG